VFRALATEGLDSESLAAGDAWMRQNAVELATAPCIRWLSSRQYAAGLRHRLRCLTTLASLVWFYHCLA
jgi:hypothetical protein